MKFCFYFSSFTNIRWLDWLVYNSLFLYMFGCRSWWIDIRYKVSNKFFFSEIFDKEIKHWWPQKYNNTVRCISLLWVLCYSSWQICGIHVILSSQIAYNELSDEWYRICFTVSRITENCDLCKRNYLTNTKLGTSLLFNSHN